MTQISSSLPHPKTELLINQQYLIQLLKWVAIRQWLFLIKSCILPLEPMMTQISSSLPHPKTELLINQQYFIQLFKEVVPLQWLLLIKSCTLPSKPMHQIGFVLSHPQKSFSPLPILTYQQGNRIPNADVAFSKSVSGTLIVLTLSVLEYVILQTGVN